MRVLIVDDEPLARRRLMRMLARIPGVEVAGEAGDGLEAAELITSLSPDLVLLDIQMPELDGLSLAARGSLPPIIFTTAHQEHAVRAFELAAADYLLKPIEQARLELAIERVRRAAVRPDPAMLQAVLQKVLSPQPERPRISARSGQTIHLFDPREICRLSASDKYTLLVRDGREYVLDESLAALEQRLGSHGFLRVHRSELINLAEVRAIHGDEGGAEVELSDGQRAPVSRRMMPLLKAKLGVQGR